ncbi:hypothetical protein V5799_009117 [Amblyomma americanum]|uniref:Uncharacterized protein n=1 Tax=Amblyomma americanum TaxID=6943 RepID=A0AAQ4FCZ1_AMBAM
MQRPTDQPLQGPPAHSSGTSSQRKAPRLPSSKPPHPPPRPAAPPGEPLSQASGSNKPKVAASADAEAIAAVPFSPQEAQPGPAIVKSAPFVSLSKGMTKLYEGGWTQCVLYMLGLLCMVVAVAFIVIVYLFLAEMQGDEIRTPAKQRDDTHCHSAPPLTGSLSRSTSDASLDVVGENVTLAETSVTHGHSATLAQ